MMLKGKYALVTGASTGIGRSTAVELAKEGAFVFISARNRQRLEQTKKLIRKEGGNTHIIVADLTKIETASSTLVKDINKAADRLDILVNVAGIWHGENEAYAGITFEKFDEQVIIDTFNVGTVAPALLTHCLIPLMPRGSSIVNISGTFENGSKGWLPYYVSKRAIEDLTIGLSEELKTKGIKVNCISPSDTATEAYKKFFPEDDENAQSPRAVAEFIVKTILNNVTGKVFVLKNGEASEGFHK